MEKEKQNVKNFHRRCNIPPARLYIEQTGQESQARAKARPEISYSKCRKENLTYDYDEEMYRLAMSAALALVYYRLREQQQARRQPVRQRL